MEKFAIGLLLGGLGGALLVANNYKMRTLVRKGQEEVQAKLDKLMDEKIEAVESATESIKDAVSDADILPEKRKRSEKKAAK
ncbi:MAG: hypothetical protein IJ393_07680 [Clostridia bacterium]|nr:hypothetical protein [Clostridia bacterium]